MICFSECSSDFGQLHHTSTAEWRSGQRVGLITQRSVDRNHAPLFLQINAWCWHCFSMGRAQSNARYGEATPATTTTRITSASADSHSTTKPKPAQRNCMQKDTYKSSVPRTTGENDGEGLCKTAATTDTSTTKAPCNNNLRHHNRGAQHNHRSNNSSSTTSTTNRTTHSNTPFNNTTQTHKCDNAKHNTHTKRNKPTCPATNQNTTGQNTAP